VFTNIFDDRGGASGHRLRLACGLDTLEAHLGGQVLDSSVWDREERLRDDYARNLG
jgi:hypothetical protein